MKVDKKTRIAQLSKLKHSLTLLCESFGLSKSVNGNYILIAVSTRQKDY